MSSNLSIKDYFALSCCFLHCFPALTKALRALGHTAALQPLPPQGFGILFKVSSSAAQLCCSGLGLSATVGKGCGKHLWVLHLCCSGTSCKHIPLPLLLASVLSLVPCYPDPHPTLPCWSGILPQLVRPASLLGTCLAAWAVSWPQVPPVGLLCSSSWGFLGLQHLSARYISACLGATLAPIPRPALAAPRQKTPLRNFAVKWELVFVHAPSSLLPQEVGGLAACPLDGPAFWQWCWIAQPRKKESTGDVSTLSIKGKLYSHSQPGGSWQQQE